MLNKPGPLTQFSTKIGNKFQDGPNQTLSLDTALGEVNKTQMTFTMFSLPHFLSLPRFFHGKRYEK